MANGVRRLPILIAVALAYYLAARLCLLLAFENASITAVWIPTGIAVAAVFLGGYKLAPGVFIGAALANLSTGAPEWTAPVIGLGNTAEALAGAWMLHCLSFNPAITRPRCAAAFAGAAVLAPILSASVGILALREAGIPLAWSDWLLWWGGDATGLLIFGAAILTVARNPLPLERSKAGLIIPATAAACTLALFGFPFALGVLIGAVGVFRGPKAVALTVALASAILITVSSQGVGWFVADNPDIALLGIQIFVAILGLVGLAAGTWAWTQRR